MTRLSGLKAGVPDASLATALAAALLVGACGERAPVAPPGPASRPSAAYVFATEELVDGGINAQDTWVAATSVTATTTTVTSTEPFFDPVTKRNTTSVQLPTVVDSVRTEAGYDAGGTVRLREFTFGTDPGAPPGSVLITGGTAQFFDVNGVPVYDSAGPILMDAIGSLDDVVVTDETIIHTDSAAMAGDSAAATSDPSLSVQGASAPPAVRAEVRGDRLVKTYPLDDPESGLRGERIREFRRGPGAWVLDRERVTTSSTAGGMSFTTEAVTRYHVVKWKSVPASDDRRRARRAARGSAAATPPAGVNAAVALDDGCGGDCSSGGGDMGDAGTDGGSTGGDSTGGGSTEVGDASGGTVSATTSGDTSAAAGLNVAYSHGILNSASSWNTMDEWIASRYKVATRVKPTFTWRDPIETQAVALHGALAASGASGFLAIGHGSGGLVARRTRQTATAAPELISGVVAIATPHHGLPLAYNGRELIQRQLTIYFGEVLARVGGSCWRIQFGWICSRMTDAIAELLPSLLNFALDAAMPVSADLRPESAFLQTLNAVPESGAGYSIEVHSQGAWKFVRLLGDWLCHPASGCGGNAMQNRMESLYTILRVCGSNFLAQLMNPGLAAKCREVRWALSKVNSLYERLVAEYNDSDAIVPAKSQRYPGIPEGHRRLIQRARDSHASELRSAAVRDRLVQLIEVHRLGA